MLWAPEYSRVGAGWLPGQRRSAVGMPPGRRLYGLRWRDWAEDDPGDSGFRVNAEKERKKDREAARNKLMSMSPMKLVSSAGETIGKSVKGMSKQLSDLGSPVPLPESVSGLGDTGGAVLSAGGAAADAAVDAVMDVTSEVTNLFRLPLAVHLVNLWEIIVHVACFVGPSALALLYSFELQVLPATALYYLSTFLYLTSHHR